MRAYANAREHFDDTLVLVGQMLEWAIVSAWEAGTLSRVHDRFSGAMVGGAEALAILGRAAPSPEGQDRIAQLEAAIATGWDQVEERLAAGAAAGTLLPFDRLRRAFDLSPTEQRTICVLVAVETQPRLRQLMRYLLDDSARQHADVGFLEEIVYGGAAARERAIHELAPDGALRRHRLVEALAAGAGAPYMLVPLRTAHRIIELFHGVLRLDPELADVGTLEVLPPSSAELVVSPALRAHVDGMVLGASRAPSRSPVIVLAGKEGAGRRALLLGAAEAAGLAALRVRAAALPREPGALAERLAALLREARLFGAMLLIEGIDLLAAEPGGAEREAVVDAALAATLLPVAGTARDGEGRANAFTAGVVRVDVPMPTEAEREALWRRALGDGVDAARLAARYSVTPGILARAARSARAFAAARPDSAAITELDVHLGLRGTLEQKLATLGSRVVTTQTWADLVLPDETREALGELVSRIQHRRRVYDDWGFAAKLAKGLGLSALFAGPPGTGKTMVAALCAADLGLDLYQIDLSRVVSKYIGETEKNLAEVFDAAEAGHSILLFDEADSLFAQRGEVKSSTDRYANMEVNFLLQRMERFSGITILTTNLASSLDPAFTRRIAFKIEFAMPDDEERERLWKAMFPAAAEVSPSVDFGELARHYVMSGGHIRNAVLRAAFLAAADEAPIGPGHLRRAADAEYAAIGKLAVTARRRPAAED